MKFTLRTLFALTFVIAAVLGSYKYGYKNGKADAFEESGVYITANEWQIVTDDGLFFALSRTPHYLYVSSTQDEAIGSHYRNIRWHDPGLKGGEHLGDITYYPYEDKFLGPKSDLPVLRWKLGLTSKRPNLEGINEMQETP